MNFFGRQPHRPSNSFNIPFPPLVRHELMMHSSRQQQHRSFPTPPPAHQSSSGRRRGATGHIPLALPPAQPPPFCSSSAAALAAIASLPPLPPKGVGETRSNVGDGQVCASASFPQVSGITTPKIVISPPTPEGQEGPKRKEEEATCPPEGPKRTKTNNEETTLTPGKASSLPSSPSSPLPTVCLCSSSPLLTLTPTLPYLSSTSSSTIRPNHPIRSSLRRRNQHQPQVIFFECKYCQDTFYSKDSLLKHQKRIHARSGGATGSRGNHNRSHSPRPTSAASSSSTTTGSREHSPSISQSDGGLPRGHYFDVNDPNQVKFFANISRQINENLRFHVDGRLSSASASMTSTHNNTRQQTSLQYQQQVNQMANMGLFNDFTINRFQQPENQRISSVKKEDLTDDHKKKSTVCICTVCGHKFHDRFSFIDHAKNNHPGVSYTYVVADEDVPSHLLSASKYNNSRGFLSPKKNSHLQIPSTVSDTSTITQPQSKMTQPSLICTLCQKSFESRNLLHEHIFECARKAKKGKKKYNYSSTSKEDSSSQKETKDQQEKPQEGTATTEDSNVYTTRSGKKRTIPPPPPPTVAVTPKKKAKSSKKEDEESTEHVKDKSPEPKTKSTSNKGEEKKTSPPSEATLDIGNESSNDSKSSRMECTKCKKIFTYAARYRSHLRTGCSHRSSLGGEREGNEDSKNKHEAEDVKNEGSGGYKENAQNIDDGENNLERDESSQSSNQSDEIDEIAHNEKKLDIWQIKQDHPQYAFKGSPAQHHSCPYCQRGFTYLANYRKHVKGICPIRQQMEEAKKKQEEGASSEGTMADGSSNATGDQNRTIPLISAGKGKLKTFPCNVCHKIYFSYVDMLKHRLSHKLSSESGSENPPSSSDSSSRKSSTEDEMSLEERVARDALQNQTLGRRTRSRRLQEKEMKESENFTSDVPISSLLESLARGGQSNMTDNNDENEMQEPQDELPDSDQVIELTDAVLVKDEAAIEETKD